MHPVLIRRVLLVGGGVACARVASLWLLLWLEKSGQQTISALPLVLLLYPEGLILPYHINAGISWALALSAALVFGSLSAVAAICILSKMLSTRGRVSRGS